MTIYLNQRELTVECDITLWDLLSEHSIKPEGIAIAINNRIIKRNEWQTTQLFDGAKITLIQATYGG
ncbi:MAG: sulfur carrier protein ThiS [Rikenellaceae bacterium]